MITNKQVKYHLISNVYVIKINIFSFQIHDENYHCETALFKTHKETLPPFILKTKAARRDLQYHQ